jgi:CheY-like chemotaxis protein
LVSGDSSFSALEWADGQGSVLTVKSRVWRRETCRTFMPDLVLLDVMMPDMDGGDVAVCIEAQLHWFNPGNQLISISSSLSPCSR